MKPLDVAVFIPLIPALPVLATWYLPWDDWLPKRLPKSIIGPYLLYCSFGAWYFDMGWWVVAAVAVWGIGVSSVAIYEHATRKDT